MIKHIVLWKLKDQAEGGNKQQNAQLMKERLEALNGKIPGLLKLEVGFDFVGSPASADVGLYSELSSREALAQYRDHPLHLAVAGFIGAVTEQRQVIDYDC